MTRIYRVRYKYREIGIERHDLMDVVARNIPEAITKASRQVLKTETFKNDDGTNGTITRSKFDATEVVLVAEA